MPGTDSGYPCTGIYELIALEFLLLEKAAVLGKLGA
jgi:hypothetical protein